jgi:hypothetical protein
MLHRILETFFLAQVMVEGLVDSAVNFKDEVLEAVRMEMPRRQRSDRARASVAPSLRERVHPRPAPQKKRMTSQPEHTLQDLPPKLYGLFRQCSRYVFVSALATFLGKG